MKQTNDIHHNLALDKNFNPGCNYLLTNNIYKKLDKNKPSMRWFRWCRSEGTANDLFATSRKTESKNKAVMCDVSQGTMLFIMYLNICFCLQRTTKYLALKIGSITDYYQWISKKLHLSFSPLDSSLPNFIFTVQNKIQIQPANQIKYFEIFIDSMPKWDVNID